MRGITATSQADVSTKDRYGISDFRMAMRWPGLSDICVCMHRGPRSRIYSRQSRSTPIIRMLCRQPIDMEDLQCRMIVTMAIQEIWWHWCGILPSLCHPPWRGKTHTLLSDFWNYSWMQEQSLTSAALTWLTEENHGSHWRDVTIQCLYASFLHCS